MVQIHAKRHVKLALFGCVRCGRFLFAPSWYELDRDVAVCTCDASRYKTTNLRAPRHVQEYWELSLRRATRRTGGGSSATRCRPFMRSVFPATAGAR